MTRIFEGAVVAACVLLPGIVLPVLAAVGKAGPGGKPEIRYAYGWSGDAELPKMYAEELNRFAAKNSSLATFKFEREQDDNLRNRIKIDLAANNLPDAFACRALNALKPMVDAHLLLDVKEHLKASKTLKWERPR